MNVQIPIAGLTLTEGQTYNGYLPVWATRPFIIRILPDSQFGNTYPTHIRVIDGGLNKKELELPYQRVTYIDLSFVAPLLTRADRNNSEGTSNFPQQVVKIWSRSEANAIMLPVFHCDETYKYTLGIDEAFPQPVKPRIPGQNTDIYFPYPIHPDDALSVVAEPVTGAPGNVVFPTTYILGDSIDITYIKKLTIKNVWGTGLDQVINYEDRLADDAEADKGLQCALRARWNMRNGQWFWDAFKDYFWSNKFTLIRGRGGVTEQAEITINLEYGSEYYNVYQEMLVSSNVVFTLNIPGVNEYVSKSFRAEITGNTGARWSNSTRTYRQQVRFKTTELQDNYVFLNGPDTPPAPPIVFSALVNPWMIGPAYAEGLTNSIYSNAAWKVEGAPDWITLDVTGGGAGDTQITATVAANTGDVRSADIVLTSLVGGETYNLPVTQLAASGNISVAPVSTRIPYLPVGEVNALVNSEGDWVIDNCPDGVTPSILSGGPGKTSITFTVADNAAAAMPARAFTVSFKNTVTGELATFVINQDAPPTSIRIIPYRLYSPQAGGSSAVCRVNSTDAWEVYHSPNWVEPVQTGGPSGDKQILNLNFTVANTSGTDRVGIFIIKNTVTGEFANCIIKQAG